MVEAVLKLIWLFFPAAIANMLPVFIRKWNFLNYPISSKWLGANKTWRGLLLGTLIASLVALLQGQTWELGLSFGFGALFGDLVGSFIKRRIKIAPGEDLIIIDQVDWIVGALFFSQFYIHWSAVDWIVLLFCYGILHVLSNLFAYAVGLKKIDFFKKNHNDISNNTGK